MDPIEIKDVPIPTSFEGATLKIKFRADTGATQFRTVSGPAESRSGNEM